MTTPTLRLAQALSIAIEAHDGQVRKGTSIPYIAHPMAVAALVLEYGGNEDQAIAGLLHDTIEDGGARYAQRIENELGTAVLAMVEACSDGTAEARAVPSNRQADSLARKAAYLRNLEQHPQTDPALLVSVCDKLHNVQSILADLYRTGPQIFDRFNVSREQTLAHYRALADIFQAKQVPAADDLARAVKKMICLAEPGAS